MSSSNSTTFRKVKSIVFNKDDEEFYNTLEKIGYFDKTFNERIKKFIKDDIENNKGSTSVFTKEQEEAILSIIRNNFKNLSVDETSLDKEEPKPSKEALGALSVLNSLRSGI